MAPPSLVCTEDPAYSERRLHDFHLLLGTTRSIERPSAEHLRLTLGTEKGLDIAVLAHEKQCCDWFRFTLAPTADGTVDLDIEVPAGTGPVQGPAPEAVGAGTPEEILDWFAREAAEASGAPAATTAAPAAAEQRPATPACGCCPQ